MLSQHQFQVDYRVKTYKEVEGVITEFNTSELSYISKTDNLHYIFKDLVDIHYNDNLGGLEILEVSPDPINAIS